MCSDASLAAEQAPHCHTFLECVHVRWGPIAHKLFGCVALLTNLLVSVNMLQGAVITLNALTGINEYAICFILPLGTAVYAFVGKIPQLCFS